MINIISKQGSIQIHPPYDLRSELQNNPTFNTLVENDLIQEKSCCSLFSTSKMTEQKKVQKAAELLIRATLAEISCTSLSVSKNTRTFSVRILPFKGSPEQEEAFIQKLEDVKSACLKATPTCSNKKWFKDFSKHVTHLEKNNTPIILE